ncbi:hypothetical protein PCE1_003621 [Barthelona sp. PCE]
MGRERSKAELSSIFSSVSLREYFKRFFGGVNVVFAILAILITATSIFFLNASYSLGGDIRMRPFEHFLYYRNISKQPKRTFIYAFDQDYNKIDALRFLSSCAGACGRFMGFLQANQQETVLFFDRTVFRIESSEHCLQRTLELCDPTIMRVYNIDSDRYAQVKPPEKVDEGFVLQAHSTSVRDAYPRNMHKATGASVLGELRKTRVLVVDSGLSRRAARSFHNLGGVTDMTSDNGSPEDKLNHGTLVASIIGGGFSKCQGVNPNAAISMYKVVNSAGKASSMALLKALETAKSTNVSIINLSLGGREFSHKRIHMAALELARAGKVVVAATGNSGPNWGTILFPGDLMEPLSVSAASETGLAPFSARGGSTLVYKYGVDVAPLPVIDCIVDGVNVWGSSLAGGCTSMSGTSAAAAVMSGYLSTLQEELLHPAIVHQIVHAAAVPQKGLSVYEQGAGVVTLSTLHEAAAKFERGVTMFPHHLNLTSEYWYPHSIQPLFYSENSAMMLNVTLICSHETDSMKVTNVVVHSDVLNVTALRAPPSSTGFLPLGLHVTVIRPMSDVETAEAILHIETTCGVITKTMHVAVIPTPPAGKRVLWDVYHQSARASASAPFDKLNTGISLFESLRRSGVFVDFATRPLYEYNLNEYAALLCIGTEYELEERERSALRTATALGMGLFLTPSRYAIVTNLTGYLSGTGFSINSTETTTRMLKSEGFGRFTLETSFLFERGGPSALCLAATDGACVGAIAEFTTRGSVAFVGGSRCTAATSRSNCRSYIKTILKFVMGQMYSVGPILTTVDPVSEATYSHVMYFGVVTTVIFFVSLLCLLDLKRQIKN